MKKELILFIIFVTVISLSFVFAVITGDTITGRASSQQTNASIMVIGGFPALEIISPENKTYSVASILLNFSVGGQESVWYSLDNSANITINGSITFSTTQGSHILYLFANSSNGNVTSKNVSFNVEIPTGTGSGGSGGGGSTGTIIGANKTPLKPTELLFEIDRGEFNLTITLGDSITEAFKIKNINENNLNIKINVEGIVDLIDIEDSISLKSFEEKNVKFVVFPLKHLVVRSGKIILNSDSFSKEISITINPRSPLIPEETKETVEKIFDLIVNQTREPLKSPELSCDDLQSLSIIELENACYNSQTEDIELIISRNQYDIIIDSLTFVINGDFESSWTCGNSCGGCDILESGEIKTYYFSPLNPEKQEIARLYVSSCEIGEIEINDC